MALNNIELEIFFPFYSTRGNSSFRASLPLIAISSFSADHDCEGRAIVGELAMPIGDLRQLGLSHDLNARTVSYSDGGSLLSHPELVEKVPLQ